MKPRHAAFPWLFLICIPGNAEVFSCPNGMVLVGEQFCIDQYEATLDGSAAKSVAGVIPAVSITQIEATGACVSVGKRLCSDAEWLRACQGPSGYTYPYGNTLQVGSCNDSGSIAVTGNYAGCITEDGVYDMVGNVGEWTNDPNGTFRGGFFGDIALNGQGCLYVTTAFNASHSDTRTGFRCCADAVLATQLVVGIDIKPGSYPNSINANSGGFLSVAVLSSNVAVGDALNFDATQVDPSTVVFGPSESAPARAGKLKDVDSDGDTDLILHFKTSSLGFECDDSEGTLVAQTYSGTHVEGTDSVKLKGCPDVSEDGVGVISGGTNRLGAELTDNQPHLFENSIDFGNDPYDEATDFDRLTPGAQKIITDGNDGGTSLLSEAFSFDILARTEAAILLKTRDEIVYINEDGKKADFLVEIDGVKIGVQVTRAVTFPITDPLSVGQAEAILTGELNDITASSQNVAEEDRWAKQVLHVFVPSVANADAIKAAYATLDSLLKGDTIVMVTLTEGDDSFLY